MQAPGAGLTEGLIERLARLEAARTVWDGQIEIGRRSEADLVAALLDSIDETILPRILVARNERGDSLRLTVASRRVHELRLLRMAAPGAAAGPGEAADLDPQDTECIAAVISLLSEFTRGTRAFSLTVEEAPAADRIDGPGLPVDVLRGALGRADDPTIETTLAAGLDALLAQQGPGVEGYLLEEDAEVVRRAGPEDPGLAALLREFHGGGAPAHGRMGGGDRERVVALVASPAGDGGQVLLAHDGGQRLAVLLRAERAETAFEALRGHLLGPAG